MTIREQTEKIERETLSPYAMLSQNTKGRKEPCPLCDIRTEFQRDRDKIIHSKAFRRLKHKTQVFITPEGDHYRTRLTHTLEVSQIARTIVRSLRLNEDLAEAMAMGHDLGHTPFGHAGEKALDKLCSSGFRHNEQSLRVVEVLENLNLTVEVLDGIKNHPGECEAQTLEGKVLKYADRIAYINHDIDDACRGGVISPQSIPKSITDILGETHSERINTLVKDIIFASQGKNDILMSEDVEKAMNALRKFMFEYVYVGSSAKKEEKKVDGIIEGIFTYYFEKPDALPIHMQEIAWTEGIERAVCDYIAGMSDRFAIYTFNDIYVPRSWNKI
ncbi:MAG: deoxyguanosinetriphosphate triphosphohydrolase [Clostridia bacterium]|nr:deoxyguanosinetriphosphate triphosphohydrolase [Clostridia bacterium]MBR2883497.1 deoxyguanosinetriphosphate triphosphohydrolase [Clostridia bacterium]